MMLKINKMGMATILKIERCCPWERVFLVKVRGVIISLTHFGLVEGDHGNGAKNNQGGSGEDGESRAIVIGER